MDTSVVKKIIESNQPFRIKTAGGDVYDVPHRDFVSWSTKRTTLMIHFDEDGKESFAYVPLLTIASVETLAPEMAE